MPAIVLKILQWIPGLSSLLEKLGASNSKAAEIRAQTEQEDLRGFYRTGRISAFHLWRYVKALIALALAIAFIVMLFIPNAGNEALNILDSFVKAVGKLFTLEM